METRRHAGTTATILVVLAISSTIVAAGEPLGEAATTTTATEAVVSTRPDSPAAPPSPWISSQLDDAVARRLTAGFELAVTQLESHSECRQLFNELGSVGLEVLSTTLYYPAELRQEREACRRAEAYTAVGFAPTWLCRRFAKVSDRRAAVLVLHEALHHAGLDEWPHDRNSPSSASISRMVSEACGL
jgi:hypothetical protein